MTKLAAVKSPEEEARDPKPSHQRDVPADGQRWEIQSVDDPAPEEDPAGYGYGV